ncbi:hypothetical protein [Mesonia maritima]|uniref:Outer membrane protein beta-barrel domain-containing protein n=1 Tax=Mesonia maritima TaxID=1793873 RepID=A0ABU1K4Y3_9FLAO|nr:hypothetical protein [Mesonia maritima]MDR6300656.1 hypothetical protein [Mesonia maritima]
MKKSSLLVLLCLVFTTNFLNAQEEETKESKLEIFVHADIGNGIIENDLEPNYNVNAENGEILLNYKFWKTLGLATGIAYSEINGNGFSSRGDFYHKRAMLKIPLLLSFDTKLGEKFRMISTFGVYSQYVVKDEYSFLLRKIDNVYEGWNFGSRLGISLIYQVYDNLGIGVHFNYQSDFSELENNNQIVNDKQKINNLNTFGLIATFGL